MVHAHQVKLANRLLRNRTTFGHTWHCTCVGRRCKSRPGIQMFVVNGYFGHRTSSHTEVVGVFSCGPSGALARPFGAASLVQILDCVRRVLVVGMRSFNPHGCWQRHSYACACHGELERWRPKPPIRMRRFTRNPAYIRDNKAHLGRRGVQRQNTQTLFFCRSWPGQDKQGKTDIHFLCVPIWGLGAPAEAAHVL